MASKILQICPAAGVFSPVLGMLSACAVVKGLLALLVALGCLMVRAVLTTFAIPGRSPCSAIFRLSWIYGG